MTLAAPYIRSGTAESSSLAASIHRLAGEAGVDVVGFGDLKQALPLGFKHLPRGIALGVAHPALARLRDDPRAMDDEALVFALSDHRDRHCQVVLEEALRTLCGYLRDQGYRYFACPPECDPMESPFSSRVTRTFSHKAAATCAGVGWVGRHGLLNHPEYGPHVAWATLLTNAPLVTGRPTLESACGSCRRCVKACPAGAISGRPWRREDGMVSLVDTERCRSVLRQNEQTTGRWVCGRCAVACTAAHLEAAG